jgi:hypothetical protein
MSLAPPPLTQLIYLKQNGYDEDLEEANQYLKKGEVYTLLYAEESSDHTDFFLVEFPYIGFNSVLFAPIAWEDIFDDLDEFDESDDD